MIDILLLALIVGAPLAAARVALSACRCATANRLRLSRAWQGALLPHGWHWVPVHDGQVQRFADPHANGYMMPNREVARLVDEAGAHRASLWYASDYDCPRDLGHMPVDAAPWSDRNTWFVRPVGQVDEVVAAQPAGCLAAAVSIAAESARTMPESDCLWAAPEGWEWLFNFGMPRLIHSERRDVAFRICTPGGAAERVDLDGRPVYSGWHKNWPDDMFWTIAYRTKSSTSRVQCGNFKYLAEAVKFGLDNFEGWHHEWN
jgi:hypothetical protein